MKYVVMAFISLLSLSNAYAQENSIKGNGNVVKQNRVVAAFSKMDISGIFNVEIRQGQENSVIVETDENLQDLIKVEVENETLKLGIKKLHNFKGSKKMMVYVSFKNVSEIKNNLVGNLSSNGSITQTDLKFTSSAVGSTDLALEVTNLVMKISAVGKTKITGKANTCNFQNRSVGGFNGGDFIVNEMILNNGAVGNTTINASKLSLKNRAVGKLNNKNLAAQNLQSVTF